MLSAATRTAASQTDLARGTLAFRVSLALAAVAAITALLSFVFWSPFERDVPMGIGNLRGTALTLLVAGVPLLLTSMRLARQGSLRADFVWVGTLGYVAYNAVMFCFAARFNTYFFLFTALLALSFWSLVTWFRALDLAQVGRNATAVPARPVAAYLFFSLAFFAFAWLQAILPALLDGTFPAVLVEAGLTQNTVWVLDFAFTFPLMFLGGWWLWRRRPWGYVLGGMMTIMLTIETAGIAVDQVFGNLHAPEASLAAVPLLVAFTLVGLVFSTLFLRGIHQRDAAP